MEQKSGSYGLEVKTVQGSSDEIVALLKNTVLGTPGKLRYKPADIIRNMQQIDNIEFIQIKKGPRVLGTTGVITRPTNTARCLYVRYLSVESPGKEQPARKTKKRQVRKSRLKQLIGEQLTNYFEQPFHEKEQPGCFYAYVETGNHQSRNLCETFGFSTSRIVNTVLFSRFSPKPSNNVRQVKPDNTDVFKHKLTEFYSNHSFFFDDRLTSFGRLYTLYEGEKPVAGARANKVVWNIVEIPGLSGFIMKRVFPYIPFLRRIFHPDNLQFLALDCLWHEPGNEHRVSELLEHICAVNNTHLGMYWGDRQTALTAYLKKDVKPGLMSKIAGTFSAYLMVRPINMSNAETAQMLSKPVYVSAVDMT